MVVPRRSDSHEDPNNKPRVEADLHTTEPPLEAEEFEIPMAEDEPQPVEPPAWKTRSPLVVMLDTVAEAAQRSESPTGEKTPAPSSPESVSIIIRICEAFIYDAEMVRHLHKCFKLHLH